MTVLDAALREAGRSPAPDEPAEALDPSERALRERIAALRAAAPAALAAAAPRVTPLLDGEAQARDFRALIDDLKPWRKGPWTLGDVRLDAEWRADWKWERLAPYLRGGAGGVVADVGCGNGYYLARWSAAPFAPRALVGFEPHPRFRSQWALIEALADTPSVSMRAGRIDSLAAWPRAFDLVLCAGVLYHVRDPVGALQTLRGSLARGGALVLETIVVPGDDPVAWCPPGRYAGARGFWSLPTVSCLAGWARRAGFTKVELSEPVKTTPEEHGDSPWSQGATLSQGLDAQDPTRTVEGLPAPWRVIARCTG